MKSITPTRYAVAIVLRDGHRPGQFLTVQRPYDDANLPGQWGLPATSVLPNEAPEDAARRVCAEKLGCSGEPIRFLGAMHQKRKGYNLLLMDIEMILQGAIQPDVGQATTNSTIYIDKNWSKDPKDLQEAAEAGSCCSSIFLNDQGLMSRSDWQLSLQK